MIRDPTLGIRAEGARNQILEMKTILSSEVMDIPEGVKIKVKAKVIQVKGPRGILTQNFKHLNLNFQLIIEEETGKQKLKVDAWFGSRKTTATIRTDLSHFSNLTTGVNQGYWYKTCFVYAHFSINASITYGNNVIEIHNFLWEKKVRKVNTLHDVTVVRSEKVKDELILDGNDIELISRSCTLINQKCHVKNKNIRKFLDGICVLNMGRQILMMETWHEKVMLGDKHGQPLNHLGMASTLF